MKRFFTTCLIAVIPFVAAADNGAASVAASVPVNTHEYFYAGIRISNTALRLSTEYRNNWGDKRRDNRHVLPIGFGVIVGHRFNENIRMDIEIDYMTGENRGNTDRATVNTNMVNLYYNWRRARNNIHPYLGIGVGAANISIDSSDYGRTSRHFNFAYQFVTGLEFNLNEHLSADIGARYRRMGDARHDAGNWTDISAWQLFFGIKTKF